MKSMQFPKMSARKPKVCAVQEIQAECVNHLKQKFKSPAPNQIWVSDITCVRISGGFVYIYAIMDLFSRKIIAFRVHHNKEASFVMQTLIHALDLRKPEHSILFHSDRAAQYDSTKFHRFCDENNITQSFSKKGCPWDNSVIEAFFKYAKLEEFSRRYFKNISQVKLITFQYIESFYNSNRPHTANNMLTPNEMETVFRKNT